MLNLPRHQFRYYDKFGTFGDFTIDLISDVKCNEVLIRKLHITATGLRQDSGDREVLLHHFTGFKKFSKPPTSTVNYLRLFEFCYSAAEFYGSDLPVIVHGGAGTGRGGLFVVVHALITHLKNSGHQELPFKTMNDFILHIRRARPGLVCNAAQLKFLWSAVVRWIQDYDELELPVLAASPTKKPRKMAPCEVCERPWYRTINNLSICSACHKFIQSCTQSNKTRCPVGGLCSTRHMEFGSCQRCRWRKCVEFGFVVHPNPPISQEEA
uniref:Tyrosine-protein phosphatase domain-containing protein n=1 Tax=Panagrellus redivivus TaxID=6233 RepID=A0A7E5A2C0_PANRE